MSTDTAGRHTIVMRALAWNSAFRVFETAISFAAMLVLVRIIAPAEYGRYGAVLGIITLLNGLGFGSFVGHALQLGDDAEPDWRLHWSAGLYIQTGAMLTAHTVAFACWFAADYRPIAPLLHIAAFGLVLDWPAQLNAVMLRRAMDFRRLKVILACSLALKLSLTVGLAWLGAGAYALVVGANVASAVPLALDLLVIQRWRPTGAWWRWPNWSRYDAALRFGGQQSASAMLSGARRALESVVFPATFGYVAIGLLGRAQALFGMTIGRGTEVLVECVYPLMPRAAADRAAFVRLATLFAQTVCWFAIPVAAYMAWEGRAISRLLYGRTWIDADPLIVPAVVAGLAGIVIVIAYDVLLAANRLRLCFTLDAATTVSASSVVLVTVVGGDLATYAWALAAVQVLTAILSGRLASPFLSAGWARLVLLPPAVCSVIALTAAAVVNAVVILESPAGTLLFSGAVYTAVVAGCFRALFPRELGIWMSRLPGGGRATWLLRLRSATPPRPVEEWSGQP